MSDVGLGATLQLDIADALRRIDDLAAQLDAATSNIPVSLEAPDASPVTAAIDAAVAAADTSVEPDADAAGVTEAIDQAVDAADPSVLVDADTEQATAELAALGEGTTATVDVDADTDDAAGAIDNLVADADSQEVSINVTADTDQAEGAIGQLGTTAEGSAGGVEELTDSTAALGAAQGATAEKTDVLGLGMSALGATVTATSGSASGLSGIMQASGGAATGYAAALAGVTTALGAFVGPAIEAQVSADRLTRSTGAFESSIRDINVGDLNGDLTDLAARLGTSDEALQDAASRIFTLGTNAGIAGPQVATTTEQVLALSLGARALNPALGESGAIADALSASLGRGGKALNAFGFSITAAEINQRALNTTGKESADQLTQYEKLAAGAAIATERYGDTLKDAFATGEANPAIQIAAIKNSFGELTEEIGAPLVSPVLDALGALAPLGLGVVSALGGVLQALVPVLDLIGALAPVLGLVATALGILGQTLSFVAGSFNGATLGLIAIGVAASGVLGPLGVMVSLATGVGLVINSVFGSSSKAKSAEFVAGVKAANAALADTTQTVHTATEAFVKSQQEALDLPPAFLAAAGGIDGMADALLEGGDALARIKGELRDTEGATNDARAAFFFADQILQNLSDELNEAAKKQFALDVATGEVDQSFLDAATSSGDYAKQLALGRIAADEQARATFDAAVAAGELTIAQRDAVFASNTAADGTVNYTAALAALRTEEEAAAAAQQRFNADFEALATRLPDVAVGLSNLGSSGIVGGLKFEFADLAQRIAEGNIGLTELQVIATGLGVPVEALQGFVDTATASIQEFVDTTVGQLPSVGTVFDAAAERAKAAERALSGVDIVAALQKQAADLHAFRENLITIVATGYDEMVAFALQGGPTAVAAIAGSLRDTNGEFANTFRENFGSFSRELDAATEEVTARGPHAVAALGIIGQEATDAFGIPLEQLSAIAGGNVQLSTEAILAGADPMAAAASATAGAGKTGFEDTWSQLPTVTQSGLDSARAVIDGARATLHGAGFGTGTQGGTGFETGFTGGATKGANAGKAAATRAISQAGNVEGAAVIAGVGVGSAFGSGIVLGIDGYVGKIRAAAARSVRAAESAARAEAQSQSPSLLFAALGRDLGAGIEQGLDASTSAVVAAAEAIVQSAAAGVAGSTLGAPQVGVASVASVGASFASGSTVVQDGAVRIEVTAEFHGAVPTEAEARTVGAALGEEIAERFMGEGAWRTDLVLAGRATS